jgi:hypothetical protein
MFDKSSFNLSVESFEFYNSKSPAAWKNIRLETDLISYVFFAVSSAAFS